MQANRLGEVPGKPEPGRASQNRVRFQDPQSQEPSSLSQLRPSAVEQEFRRRVEEYTSDSEDVRIGNINQGMLGNLVLSNNFVVYKDTFNAPNHSW